MSLEEATKRRENRQNQLNKFDRYITRTVEHIHRVQNNMVTIITKYRGRLGLTEEQCRECMHNVMKHDRSKFSTEQFHSYIELTEYYHQRKKLFNKDYQYPSGVEQKVDKAVENHYDAENHHPERFKDCCGKFDICETIETVCDLQAMAQEFREGSCRGYWEKIWIKKHYKFFHDDWNWECVRVWMDETIQCFEEDIRGEL